MIEIRHLTKIYGSRAAVRNLNLKLANGKIYGLLGPNGAGKSTTMNMLTGSLAPTSGTVRINGFDMFEQPILAKRQIGYLPEQPPLYADMTPQEYLAFVAEAKGLAPVHAARQVAEVMQLTDITAHKDRLIKHLSKGYCQRVGIAQAMLGNPGVIVLDEPTVGLDPKQLYEIRALIARLGEQCTVIISSHILSEICEICDELIILSEGKLVAVGTLAEMEKMLGDTETLCLTVRGDEAGISAVLDGIGGIKNYTVRACAEPGTLAAELQCTRGTDLRDTVFFAMAEHRYAVLRMESGQKTLESVFLALTAKDESQASDGTQENRPEAAPRREGETDESDL